MQPTPRRAPAARRRGGWRRLCGPGALLPYSRTPHHRFGLPGQRVAVPQAGKHRSVAGVAGYGLFAFKGGTGGGVGGFAGVREGRCGWCGGRGGGALMLGAGWVRLLTGRSGSLRCGGGLPRWGRRYRTQTKGGWGRWTRWGWTRPCFNAGGGGTPAVEPQRPQLCGPGAFVPYSRIRRRFGFPGQRVAVPWAGKHRSSQSRGMRVTVHSATPVAAAVRAGPPAPRAGIPIPQTGLSLLGVNGAPTFALSVSVPPSPGLSVTLRAGSVRTVFLNPLPVWVSRSAGRSSVGGELPFVAGCGLRSAPRPRWRLLSGTGPPAMRAGIPIPQMGLSLLG